MKTLESEVVIIGGGIPGTAAAYFLAEAGKDVILLDKSEIGCEASGRNGGGVRQQGRDPAELPFAMASVKIWETLEQRLGMDLEYRQWGNIYMAADEQSLEGLRETGERERASGLPVEMVDHRQIEELTGVRVSGVIGGKYNPTDGHANPMLVTKAFGAAAVRAGARIFQNTPVTAMRAKNGEIEAVLTEEMEIRTRTAVLAAGPWSVDLARTVDIEIPMKPIRSQLLVTERVPKPFPQFLSLVDHGTYWRPTVSGNIHIGDASTLDTGRITFDKRSSETIIEHMAKVTARVFPDLAGVKVVRSWAGTNDGTPDMVAILGPCAKVKGLIIATGYSGHGFCLGPISGKVISDLITRGESPLPLDQVRLERFPAGALVDSELAI